MAIIYVCSPYGGLEENYFRAQNYCRYVIEKGNIPVCPVTMFHGVYDDRVPQEREVYRKAGKELLKLCDEIWVFGKNMSSDINTVNGLGKKVIYIQDTFRFNNTSETLSVLLREFEIQTGRTVNRGILENMLFYLNQGQTDKLIIAAIKKAAKVNAGWNYAEGILKNCLSRGITTAEELSRQKPQRKEKSTMASYELDLYEKMINSKD